MQEQGFFPWYLRPGFFLAQYEWGRYRGVPTRHKGDDMKQSIEWHEECLENEIASVKALNEESQRLSAKITRSQIDIGILYAQIQRAKSEKKTAFDGERYQPIRGGKTVLR